MMRPPRADGPVRRIQIRSAVPQSAAGPENRRTGHSKRILRSVREVGTLARAYSGPSHVGKHLLAKEVIRSRLIPFAGFS